MFSLKVWAKNVSVRYKQQEMHTVYKDLQQTLTQDLVISNAKTARSAPQRGVSGAITTFVSRCFSSGSRRKDLPPDLRCSPSSSAVHAVETLVSLQGCSRSCFWICNLQTWISSPPGLDLVKKEKVFKSIKNKKKAGLLPFLDLLFSQFPSLEVAIVASFLCLPPEIFSVYVSISTYPRKKHLKNHQTHKWGHSYIFASYLAIKPNNTYWKLFHKC